MVATHIFHKLVINARLFMKKASWGFCVLVFDSSVNLLVIQNLVTLVLQVVLGPGLRLGARHVRTVLAPPYMLPWITRQVCIVLCFVVGEI